MNQSFQIRYVKRQEIDPAKWDDCIDRSSNGLVYAYSSYLDQMATHWDGLVWNDYEAVMPLTWNKKWGIKYLYQPPLTQQLGIFFREPFPDQTETDTLAKAPAQASSRSDTNTQTGTRTLLVRAFLAAASLHFRFAEIFLNHENAMAGQGFTLESRMNYILPLGAPYSHIHAGYSPALLKNLVTAGTFPLRYTASFDPAEAVTIYYNTYRERLPHVKRKDYDRFLKVGLQLQKEEGLLVRAVYEDRKSPSPFQSPEPPPDQPDFHPQDRLQDQTRYQLLAVTLLLKKNDRIYLILPTTLAAGKSRQANHFLLDQLIREFAGRDLILDFEGSDIPGIARFYKKFAPLEQPFFFYRLNRLPWPLRLLKK